MENSEEVLAADMPETATAKRIREAVLILMGDSPLEGPADHLADFVLDNCPHELGIDHVSHELVVSVIEGMKAEQQDAASVNEEGTASEADQSQEDSFEHLADLIAKLNAIDPTDVLKLAAMKDPDATVRNAAVKGLHEIARLNAIHQGDAARDARRDANQ